MAKDLENKVYKVSSVDEALKLALDFKTNGKYDVFRGQACNWLVLSSLHRGGSKNFEKNKEKIGRFYYFLSQKTELRNHLNNTHDVFAIAQHYGLPTPYVDFTFNPEIAIYFATNSLKNKINKIATIICVNLNDFAELVDFVKPAIFKNEFPAEFVTIDVANLWRLQAQEGCFLYTPFAGIENVYHFDRIEFPFTQKYEKIKPYQIFPVRKSSLEILLENYFHNERLIKWNEFVEKNFPKIHKSSIGKSHDIFDYLDIKTKKHTSWSNRNILEWQKSKSQQWKEIQSHQQIEINLYSSKTLADNYTDIVSFILSILNTKTLDRTFLASVMSS